MKTKLIVTSAFLAAFAACEARSGEPVHRPMALMVFFDGGRADCLLNADCPNLRSLVEGTWAERYRCAWSDAGANLDGVPTLSYANHTSLITGTLPDRHRVFKNQDVRSRPPTEATWLTLLRKACPELKTVAVFSDSNDALIGKDPEERVFVAETKDPWECDALSADRMAAIYSGDDAPDAAMFFLHETDMTGHYKGYYPSSDEYLAAFARADARLGKVLSAIKSRPTFGEEDWLITFTTDHGGRGVFHGPDDGHCHTIPIVVAGRNVGHGVMLGMPRIYDIPVTLLAHFGVRDLPFVVVGHTVGRTVQPASPAEADEGLAYRCAFDGDLPATVDAVAAKDRCVSRWGFTHNTMVAVPAKEGEGAPSPLYGRIEGRDVPAAFKLERSADVFAGDHPAFTVAFWVRDDGSTYEANPILFSNRNFYKENGPGFSVFMRGSVPEGGRGICLTWSMANGAPKTLGAFIPERGKWSFIAVVARPDGTMMFYQGRSDGRLNWIAGDGTGAALASGLPAFLGQDGTGEYRAGPDVDVDELSVWRRALSTDEIYRLFKKKIN